MRTKLVECVPNFSEGRDAAVIEKIAGTFRGREGVKLLDYSADADHNRMVVTAVGEPEAMLAAVVDAVGVAVQNIDLTKHKGSHPRMGAADVIPFIPMGSMNMSEAAALSRMTSEAIWERWRVPIYLYEQSATAPRRVNLATVRQGEFEGLAAKMRQRDWRPDYGDPTPHPTAGASIVGARMPLIAYNVNLNSVDLRVAEAVARRVRHIDGGLGAVKAMGVRLESQGCVQVSMNLTNYNRTAIYQAHEMVRMEAARWGVTVAGGELIGLMPLQALLDTAAYYLGMEHLDKEQILDVAMNNE